MLGGLILPRERRCRHNVRVSGRWLVLGVLAACVLAVLSTRSQDPSLLQDSDTRALLTALRERDDPWSWFTSDWPLQNHFYRPLSALSFECDWRLWGDRAAGYGWTNAVLAAACAVALAWLVWEVFRTAWQTVAATLLVTIWLRDSGHAISPLFFWAAGLVLVASLALRGRLNWCLPAAAGLWYLGVEMAGISHLQTRIVGWLPGRTASLMTLFCLLAMACYAKYVTSGPRAAPPIEPKPTDPPPTKSTRPASPPARHRWVWLTASLVCGALALASYEQAAMLPVVLIPLAWMLKQRGYRVTAGPVVGFWILLAVYLAARHAFVPWEASDYQMQQLRTGPGVRLSLFEYWVPGALALQPIWLQLELGLGALWIPQFYSELSRFVSFGATVWMVSVSRARTDVIGGWLMSGLAFLPLAWAKHFDHYHLWPMALRAVMVVALLSVAGSAVVNAVSRPAVQAPPRRDPAPGSLPHP